MNDNIDSLLVDMIELGLSEPRVKIEVNSIILAEKYEKREVSTEKYTILFPSLDKIIGEIKEEQILASLKELDCKVNMQRENYKTTYECIRDSLTNLKIGGYKETLRNFIKMHAASFYIKVRVKLFIDGKLIDSVTNWDPDEKIEFN